MKKKELKARIEELEKRLDALAVEVVTQKAVKTLPAPWPVTHPYPAAPYTPYITWDSNKVTCDSPLNLPIQKGWPRQPGVCAAA